jgi:hypothetical protein
MDDLSLVGVHDDGEHLLVVGPSGQRFRLRVDDALRAAVRRDRARLSQLQLESEGRLRPREIQARIRAGETAEEVAEAAGLAVEHVRKYEGPVLAEREYVAEQARQVRVQRGGVGGTLGETVAERLTQREVELESVVWDAWRGEDGSWTVALDFEAGSSIRQARWMYNVSVRHVSPQNDEARWLTDEEAGSGSTAATTSAARRLAPVRDRVFDVEAAGSSSRSAPEETAAVDLLDTLRERRGRRSRALTEDEELAGAPDPVREAIDSLLSRAEAMSDPPAAHPARSRPQDARDGEVLVLPDAEPIISVEVEEEEPAEAEEEAPVAAGRRPPPPPSGSRKHRRASVPSWDDIDFGHRRD